MWSEIPGSTAAAVFGAWVVATVFLSSISPLPSDDPQSPLVVTLNAAFNIGFFGVLFAAVSRRRIIYVASGLAGGAAAIMATMCGLDGHSGLWIPAQGLIGAAFLVHAVRSLRI